MDDRITHRGGCHCGAVRFEVDAPARIEALACDCSRCRQLAFLHLIVPASRFRIVAGEALLTTYTFGTGVARHLFCSRCGVQAFYVPRSNPDGWSVNVRCIDEGTLEHVLVTPFDGRNWNAGAIGHLSRE